MRTNGAHKSNDNNTPMFTGQNNTTQKKKKQGRRKRKTAREWIKSFVLKQTKCSNIEIF
jgi:hypothetical protein